MSSSLPATLAQKVWTMFLSFSERDVMLPVFVLFFAFPDQLKLRGLLYMKQAMDTPGPPQRYDHKVLLEINARQNCDGGSEDQSASQSQGSVYLFIYLIN